MSDGNESSNEPKAKASVFAGLAAQARDLGIEHVSFGCNIARFLAGADVGIGMAEAWWCTGRLSSGTVAARGTGRTGEEAFRSLLDGVREYHARKSASE